MRSALNQPMDAEIPLTSARGEELDGMIVKLADAGAFERAGVERTAVLTSLRFAVENVGGQPVIRVTSARPVVEPFLNFLLEVDWPQGRMVREYTVLLDPPVFMTEGPSRRDDSADRGAVVEADRALVAPAPIERSASAAEELERADEGREVGDEELLGGADDAVAAAGGAGADAAGEIASLDELQADSASLDAEEGATPLTDASAPNSDARAARAAADGARAAPLDAAAGERRGAGEGSGGSRAGGVRAADAQAPREVQVERGDTLYEIAEDNLAERTTVEQMMLALLDANRAAFINENINLVRAGSILRVPQGTEVRARSQAQALAEIGRQSDLWREYRDNLRGTTANTQLADRSGEASETASEEAAAPVEVAGGGDVADGAGAEAPDDTDASGGLTPEAREILESARAEVRGRDELRIVADDTSSTVGANATVESEENEQDGRLGEIDRQLQLAREELSSSRIEGSDLDDQASELQSTSESLDALVALRQNDIARLETQLAAARANGAEEASGEAAAMDVDAQGDAESDGTESPSVVTTLAGEGGGAVQRAGETGEAGEEAVATADRASEELAAEASAAMGELEEESENAIAAAGDSIEPLGPVDEAEPGAAVTDGEPVASEPATDAGASAPWYASLLQDPVRLGIAGAGALGLIALGALFMRRRARDDEDDLSGFEDGKVEFIDEEESATLQAELDAQSAARVAADKAVADEFAAGAAPADPSPAGTAAAGVAGAAIGAAGLAGAGAAADAAAPDEGEPDKDDTISEVDVYLAYGLHGQAEELLVKANERQPENKLYAAKLLQTYHAQGNAEAFESGAEDFRARFGDTDAAWTDIAAMGRELRPDSAMFLESGAGEVAAEGTARHGASSFDDSDFVLDDGSADVSSSVSRDFSSADESFDFDAEGFVSNEVDGTDPAATSDTIEFGSTLDEAAPTGSLDAKEGEEGFESFELSESTPEADSSDTLDPDDETLLMDQSLDPAFAFDEGDLEATGDFSRIAEELSAEDGSIDFPGFEETAATNEATTDTDRGLSAELSEDDSLDGALLLDGLDADGPPAADAADDAGKGTGPDGLDAGELSEDDLSLDLGQLDEVALDLEDTSIDDSALLDDPALLDESAAGELDDDVDPLDMTVQNELLDGTATPLDSEDEMETMMDLAKAYIDMGDKDSASSALDEVVKSGSPDQVSEAETLLRKIS